MSERVSERASVYYYGTHISKFTEWNKLDNISLSNFRSNRQPEEREGEIE